MNKPFAVKPVLDALTTCALLTGLLCGTALAKVEPSEVRVSAHKVQHTKNPRGLPDYLKDASNSPVGQAAVGAAAAYFGIDPDKAVLALKATGKFVSAEGEEVRLSLLTDRGYQPCYAKFSDVSRAGTGAIGFTQQNGKVSVYIWLQRRPLFQGRSWVETDVKLYSVPKAEYRALVQAGKCMKPGTVLFSRKW